MKISNYSSYKSFFKINSNYRDIKNNFNFAFCANLRSNYDSYLRSALAESYDNRIEYEFNSFINRAGKVDFGEFCDISSRNPQILKMAQEQLNLKEEGIKCTPKTVANAALILKQFLDNKYGDNYRLISVGTSPACIAEVMSALGVDVVFAPISSLSNYIDDDLNESICSNLVNKPNVLKLLKYLDKKGVNPNDDKMNILIDYCSSGMSLILMRHLLLEINSISWKNLHDYSITQLLASALRYAGRSSAALNKEDLYNIAYDMQYNNMEKICNVPHFHVNNNYRADGYIISLGKDDSELFDEFESFSQPLARMFLLCAINEAAKSKKIRKNPD